MSEITETTHIERVVLAFRGDVDGSFKGAHLERFTVIKRDGVEVARIPGKATTISQAAKEGFTWPAVIKEMNAGLILACEQKDAQIALLSAQAEEAVSQAHAQMREAQQLAAATLAEIQDLRTRLHAYEDTALDEEQQTGMKAWFKRLFS